MNLYVYTFDENQMIEIRPQTHYHDPLNILVEKPHNLGQILFDDA